MASPDGTASPAGWRVEPDALVRLDPALAESACCWSRRRSSPRRGSKSIDRARAIFAPTVVAVTGAGRSGSRRLLGYSGAWSTLFDIVAEGLKPELVHALGATYHTEPLPQSGLLPDITIECTGVPSVVVDAISTEANDGITCLTGVSGVGHKLPLDVGGLNRQAVLRNDVIFGSVTANMRHYRQAAEALAAADRGWLRRLITRRVPLTRFTDGFERHDDVKVVLELGATTA